MHEIVVMDISQCYMPHRDWSYNGCAISTYYCIVDKVWAYILLMWQSYNVIYQLHIQITSDEACIEMVFIHWIDPHIKEI